MQLLLHIGCVPDVRASLLWAVHECVEILHIQLCSGRGILASTPRHLSAFVCLQLNRCLEVGLSLTLLAALLCTSCELTFGTSPLQLFPPQHCQGRGVVWHPGRRSG